MEIIYYFYVYLTDKLNSNRIALRIKKNKSIVKLIKPILRLINLINNRSNYLKQRIIKLKQIKTNNKK